MQKITPFLWFNNQAEEAVNFYTHIFKNSKVKNSARYDEAGSKVSGRPAGSVMTVEFQIEGQEFIALNGGPIFKFNPSISFLVGCKTKEEVDKLWQALSIDGKVLMELGSYPFSERYGWIQDKYGVSWQIIFLKEVKQKITPMIMFVGKVCGKAEEAINFYTSTFNKAKKGDAMRYGVNEKPDKEGTIKYAQFNLEGQEFAAMDSAHKHKFAFNEAISFVINCETQQEIDHYWYALTKDGAEVQCGWLKDRYGLSWQVVPIIMNKLMASKDVNKSQNVMKAMLQMKKLDISTLKQAYDQK